MDKISGIIPSSARVSAVDLKDAAPIRPGTPSFGRPEGVSTLKAAAQQAARDAEIAADTPKVAPATQDWRSKDAMQAKLASEVANNFFMKNTTVADAPSAGGRMGNSNSLKALSFGDESKPTGFKDDEIGSFQARTLPGYDDEENETPLRQPEGLYPKGSFIDRKV